MNFRGKYKPETVGFQIAPMIDVVFLLLCFFVTSQVFTQWETEIDIQLPSAAKSEMNPRLPGEIILNIHKDGTVVVNSRWLSEKELNVLLRGLVDEKTGFPGQPVLLRADRETAYAHVIRVLDLCAQHDIWNIAFATVKADDTKGP